MKGLKLVLFGIALILVGIAFTCSSQYTLGGAELLLLIAGLSVAFYGVSKED